MSEADDVAAVLDQVVQLDSSPQEVELGEAVSRAISARSVPARLDRDPEVAARLRALAPGEPCPLCGRKAL